MPVEAMQTGRAAHDQAERSLDPVRGTPVKIPMPSMMTRAMTT